MVETMGIKAGYKQTEVGIIPMDWDVKKLTDLVDKFVNGGTPSTQIAEYWNGNIPWITGADILNQKVAVIRRYISKEAVKNSSTNIIEKGNLLLVSRTGVGKLSITPFDIAISQDFTGIYVKSSELDTVYLFRYFDFAQKELKTQNQGTSIQGITRETLSSIKIPVPPTKTEQTAIATALNDADALITQLEKLIAKKRAIKQGAMQELLKPKKGWGAKNLGKIADIRRGASPRPIKDPKWFSDNGRGWIRISDVTSSNVYLNSTTQYLSEDGARNSVAVNRGDLIMSICATIGIPIIINIPACIHDGFVLFKNYEKELDTFFLYFFLQVKTEILTGKGQPGTQKNLNTTIVGDIEIDYPDVDEQRKIGLILRDIDIEISGLEMKLDKLKMLKQGMMQNLLTGRIRLV